jgi:hypothetical protein
LNIDWNIAAALKACWPTFAKILSGLISGAGFLRKPSRVAGGKKLILLKNFQAPG